MLDAVKRDAWQYFGMGEFRAVKKLPNGATVRIVIRMPKTPARAPAQVQAWADIESARSSTPSTRAQAVPFTERRVS